MVFGGEVLSTSNSVPRVYKHPSLGDNYAVKKSVSTSNNEQAIPEANSNKSKFQIRSIVEIYENPVEEQEQDKCTFKNSGHFEETTTKEVITDTAGRNILKNGVTKSLVAAILLHIMSLSIHLYAVDIY